jgi:3-oxoacyl-(acyl-carrier-protein) synthase
MRPLAITGRSSFSGLGIGAASFEGGLAAGRTAIAPVPFDQPRTRARTGAVIADFDAAQYIPAARLRRIDRIGQLAIAAARLALDDARLVPRETIDAARAGVVIGSATAGLHTLVSYLDGLAQRGRAGASAMDFSNTVGNAAASLCGLELGLRGPNLTLACKEASAAGAIAAAAGLLSGDQADALVTGGVDDFEALYFAVHDAFGALAHDAGQGEASRPFDRRRNGFVMGSGSFLLALERQPFAAARGAHVLGWLRGVGATAARATLNAWPEDAGALARAMSEALADAGAEPADVAVVFASANSTVALDRVEATALADLFGDRGVPVVAIKGALGESGAAAAAALQAALDALRRRRLPPTAGHEVPDPACPVDVSPVERPLAAGPLVALVNSFASGGTSYSLAVSA